MNSERWQQIEDLFQSALEHAPQQRAVFLTAACGGDESLCREVESLIASYEQDEGFIETPACELAVPLFADQPAEIPAGQAIGHYTVLAVLGIGGMGEVYLAEDTRLGRKVALKLLSDVFTHDCDRLHRFEQEARAASALNHPHILTIYEIGQINDVHFIAMEFIDGETLRQWMASRIGQIGDVLTVTEQVAAALDAAHAAGIVHRDVKPENIMVRRDGYVKIVDFGLAKLTTPDADGTPAPTPARAQRETLPGVVLGTTRYMSPEQTRGLQVDARTDLWSLGVVLYEMLTGHVPFEGPTPSDVLAAILQREPPPVSRYASEVPEALAWVVAKALTKEREERYQTAREMLADVRRLRQQCEVAMALARSAPPPFEPGAIVAVSRTAGSLTQAQSPQLYTFPHLGQPYSRYEGPTVMDTEGKKTVVFVDQAHFTKGADEVYQLLGAQAVAQLKLQLEEMIDAALQAAGIALEGLHRESTGDGVMLILANPEQGCRFAEALHRAAARYNQSRSHPDAQRHFRIGIYTDHVSFICPVDDKGTARLIAGGMAPAFAQRLETACRTGEVLICPQTWAALPSLMQQQYGPKKKVRGKAHDRTLWAHRQKVIEPAPWDRPGVLSTFRQAPLRLSVSLLGLLLAGLCAVFVVPRLADQTTLQRPALPTLSVPASAEPPTPLGTPYALGLALGATGLVVMALGGLGHHAGHSSVAHHLPGHASPPGGHGHHDLSLHGHSHGHGHLFGGKFWALLSPRVVFSFLVGAGASGLLLGRWLSEPLVAVGALAGGVLFERYVVTPIWNGLLRFASAPARTLEQAVFEVARAATDFDAQGQGLITIELDGQLVQVLGILRPEQRASGIRVRQGGRVRIDAVDAVRNRCRVSSLDP